MLLSTMTARVTRSAAKLGFRGVVYNINDDKFYTDANGDQFDDLTVDVAAEQAGYLFQNSGYYQSGNNHTNNVDVIENVGSNTATTIRFTSGAAGDSGVEFPTYVAAQGDWYDRNTGVITIKGVDKSAFIMLRVGCDIEPDVDESQAELVLDVKVNGTSGEYIFQIKTLLTSMTQGAEIEYSGLVNVPVFIGETLADDGSARATITPKVLLTNTDGDIKPVSLVVYLWR